MVPIGNVDPDAGRHVTLTSEQLSDAVGVAKATIAPVGEVAFTDWLAGQGPMFGGVESMTVTVKEQGAVLPKESIAAQLTVVTPRTKLEPDAGVQETVTGAVPPLVVAVKFTTAVHFPASVP